MQKLNELCDAAGVTRISEVLSPIVRSCVIFCERLNSVHIFTFHSIENGIVIEIRVDSSNLPLVFDIIRYTCNGRNVHLVPVGTFDEQVENLRRSLNL